MNLLEIKIDAINDAIRILKGNFSNGVWIVLFFCSLSAIFFSIYLQYATKKKDGRLGDHNPEKFSFAYAAFDNLFRIGAGMLAMAFIFRLASTILSPKWVESDDMIILLGLGVGFLASFGVDRLIMILTKNTNILNSPNPYKDISKKISEPKQDE